MYILHLTGILLIIAMLITGAALVLKIMKLEKEIIAEKNEKMEEAADSWPLEDTSD